MGYVHAKIQLKNPRLQKLKPISIKAMVDTGALMLCIPVHIAIQLELELDENTKREVTTADGKKQNGTLRWPHRGSLRKPQLLCWGHWFWVTKYYWALYQWKTWI